MVLITLSDLRADLVGAVGGEAGWTPELDRFAAQSHWVGRAITASSSPVPAVVSLVTGVDPWQHGVLSHLFYQRRSDLQTLAEMMKDAGFSTRVFAPGEGATQFGALEGFESVHGLGDGQAAVAALRGLGSEPELLWIHIPYVGFPYRDRRAQLPTLESRPAPARAMIQRVELLPFADPSKPMPAGLATAARELYRHEVAWADFQLGRCFRALRESRVLDDAIVVVTALHGTELGEHGQALFAQNLSRESIEVPMVIHWPGGRKPPVPTGPVAQARLWATLAEAIGHTPDPVHLPSLFHGAAEPILSSLYLHDAKNRYSVITSEGEETVQLTLTVPFAAAEEKFFAAQVAEAGRRRNPGKRMAEELRRRLVRQFERTLPFSGMPVPSGEAAAPETVLERWAEAGGTERLKNPELEAYLTAAAERRWRRFVDQERTPKQERRRWAG